MILFLVLGIILLVVGYNVGPQPVPLNQLEIWGGWICLIVALVLFILYISRGGPAQGTGPGPGGRRGRWYWY